MDNLFDLPPLPRFIPPKDGWDNATRVYTADQMQAHAREAQADMIGRLAQMQEHEAIEWLLKARQNWWKS